MKSKNNRKSNNNNNQNFDNQLLMSSFTYKTEPPVEPSRDKFISNYLEPFIILFGLVTNIILIYIVYKKKRTDTFQTRKPMRYLLITILICDVWYLLAELNAKMVAMANIVDINMFEGSCQLLAYLLNLSAVLNEILLIVAAYIVLKISLIPKKTYNIDVYNDFFIPSMRDTNGNRLGRLASIFKRSNSLPPQNRLKHRMANRSHAAANDDTVEDEQQLRRSKKRTSIFHKFSMRRKRAATTSRREAGRVNCSQHVDSSTAAISMKIVNEKNQRHMVNNMVSTNNHRNFNQELVSPAVSMRQVRKENKPAEPLKLETDETYFNLALREKFLLLLSIFTCMYLLSFFFWIRGVDSGTPHKTKKNKIKDEFLMLMNDDEVDVFKNSELNDPDGSNASVHSPANMELINTHLEGLFGDPDQLSCKTHGLYLNFVNMFVFTVAVLRAIALIFNVIASVLFIIRFRKDLLTSMFNSFKRHDENYYSKSKLVHFRSFKFTLITDCEQSHDVMHSGRCKSPMKSNDDFSRREKDSNMSDEVFNVGGSDTGLSALSKKKDKIKKLIESQNKLYFSHLHFVRHYVASMLLYSLLISFSVYHDVYNSLKTILVSINLADAALVDASTTNYSSLLHLLARSSKFLVYLLFSAHIKIFFRLSKTSSSSSYTPNNQIIAADV